jgi:hypothetical protein
MSDESTIKATDYKEFPEQAILGKATPKDLLSMDTEHVQEIGSLRDDEGLQQKFLNSSRR